MDLVSETGPVRRDFVPLKLLIKTVGSARSVGMRKKGSLGNSPLGEQQRPPNIKRRGEEDVRDRW